MAAQTLKILREINNYTQAYVAEDVLEISKTTYGRLETNPQKLTIEQAIKLSKLYNVGIANLQSEEAPIILFRESSAKNSTLSNGSSAKMNIPDTDNGEIILLLRSEIEFLKKQNEELKKLLGISAISTTTQV